MNNQNNEDKIILIMSEELIKVLVQSGLLESWALPWIENGIKFFLPRIPKPVKQRLITILRRYICGGGNGV